MTLQLSPPIHTEGAETAWLREVRAGRWQDGPCVAELESRLSCLASVPASHVVATDSCTRAIACAGSLLIGPKITTWRETFPGAYTWAQEATFLPFGTAPVDVSCDLWGLRRATGTIVDAAHRWRPVEIQERFHDGAMAVAWSFGCQKELPGVRGGAVVFREECPEAREWLRTHKGRMANADAAFLVEQLPYAEEWRTARLQVLEWYRELLPPFLLRTLTSEASGHLCVMRFPSTARRDRVRDHLHSVGVECSVHFPVSTAICRSVLSLPCHPGITRKDVERVVGEIERAG